VTFAWLVWEVTEDPLWSLVHADRYFATGSSGYGLRQAAHGAGAFSAR
jgi:hypothetical protein